MPSLSEVVSPVSRLLAWLTSSKFRIEYRTARSDVSWSASFLNSPVGALRPVTVWPASQCGWLKIGENKYGCDVWEKPDGSRITIRAGYEPLVPARCPGRSELRKPVRFCS
jgi:hypothetical protein